MYDPKLKGRFFFDNPEDARYYAQRQGTLTGEVKSVDVPEKMVNVGKKWQREEEVQITSW